MVQKNETKSLMLEQELSVEVGGITGSEWVGM